MPVTEELIRQLWTDLEEVVDDSELVRLKELTLDPTTAAKIELEKIEDQMKAKYGDKAKVDNWDGWQDPGFLMSVRITSMGYGVLAGDSKENFVAVRWPGSKDGGATDI